MARKSRGRAPQEDFEPDEVDAFSKNREKILLDDAGEYGETNGISDEGSDEEVMRLEDSGDSSEGSGDENASDGSSEDVDDLAEEEMGEEEEGWGGRQNYYGGDDLSDDEDTKQITEEAIRQQKKHLKDLSMLDYVDEDMEEGWQKTAEKFDQASNSLKFDITTQGVNFSQLEEQERVRILQSNLPEFEPLLKEMISLQQTFKSLKSTEQTEVSSAKTTAISAYLGAISAYFAILTERLSSEESIFTMKDNPVMETILATRELWRQANELTEDVKSEDVKVEDFEVSESSGDEHSGLVSDVSDVSDASDSEGSLISRADQDKEARIDDDVSFDITSKRKVRKDLTRNGGNDYKESIIPEDVDKEDKQRRRRTLRFYTSKIDQAASKNSQDRYSGDVDIPYKERLFERQQRLIEEARKRGLEQKDDLNDANESDGEARDDAGDDALVSDPDLGGNDYYSELASEKKSKKLARQQAFDQASKAAKQGLIDEATEGLGENGKRAINYQILKNKGLTPHRRKDNRNARVKKRKKYDKAQKKLKSVRQVYDSNNRGPYEGEKTGIKKGLSRSVKLV